MKLDKIKFASLIGFVSCRYALTITQDDMREIDELVNIEMPELQAVYPLAEDVNHLMALMAVGQKKIEAIRIHRKLTGRGLKESKDEIEKHWPKLSNHYVPPVGGPAFPVTQIAAKPASDHTLGDILANATAQDIKGRN